jgi:uncharacterized membrane protein YebE (DUF533 family)
MASMTKRLTISQDACTETLALLITTAWADGRLDDREKQGVRGAAEVFNLTKELRARLDALLEKPLPFDELLLDELSPKDRAFAFVAAAWMTGADEEVDAKEEELLAKLASSFELGDDQRTRLLAIARDLPPLSDGRPWSDQVVSLFKAIPPTLEGPGDYEVAFE